VLSKVDLVSGNRADEMRSRIRRPREGDWQQSHAVSAVSGTGVDGLLAAIAAFAQSMIPAEPALVTRERQRTILSEVVAALDGACDLAGRGAGEELVAEQLRRAATGLGRLTGRVDVEDILDVIFRDFCIGK
jgi:tRNA modification GTPase